MLEKYYKQLKEKVLIWFSNKSTIGPNREADSYYLLVDTINKIVHFHTSDNDGEACTYDIVLNTLVGKFMLKDNLNNDVLLDSCLKPIQFLRHVVSELCLNNVNIVESRIEDFHPGIKFDTIVTRAFAPIPSCRRACRSLPAISWSTSPTHA